MTISRFGSNAVNFNHMYNVFPSDNNSVRVPGDTQKLYESLIQSSQLEKLPFRKEISGTFLTQLQDKQICELYPNYFFIRFSSQLDSITVVSSLKCGPVAQRFALVEYENATYVDLFRNQEDLKFCEEMKGYILSLASSQHKEHENRIDKGYLSLEEFCNFFENFYQKRPLIFNELATKIISSAIDAENSLQDKFNHFSLVHQSPARVTDEVKFFALQSRKGCLENAISSHPAFYADCSAEIAKGLLEGTPYGTFLIWPNKEQKDVFIISRVGVHGQIEDLSLRVEEGKGIYSNGRLYYQFVQYPFFFMSIRDYFTNDQYSQMKLELNIQSLDKIIYETAGNSLLDTLLKCRLITFYLDKTDCMGR